MTGKVIETCIKCGEESVLGVNAISTANGAVCDDCTGTVRAVNGYVIDSCVCFEKEGDNPKCPEHGGG